MAKIGMRVAVASGLTGFLLGIAGTFGLFRAEGYPVTLHRDPPALQKIYRAFSDIYNGYYRAIPGNQLADGAISGMTSVLNDPFTDYFTPQQAQQFQSMLSSSMVGIGVEIEESAGLPKVVSVLPNSPASKVGIAAGDVITEVDGKSLHNLSLSQVSSYIKGKAGTVKTLAIQRKGRLLTKRVTLAAVQKPSVSGKMIAPHIGYLEISVVADQTFQQTEAELNQLKKQGATKIILDLRGNPGGYLNEAVQIAGLFLPTNDVVVKTENRGGTLHVYRSNGPGSKLPMVVLINQDTASAAEILAASLHQDAGIPLIGEKSFGKGTAQVTDTFSDGSELKYTVEKWLTPNNTWINKKGIQPQVPVALAPRAIIGNLSSDNQLQAAVRWLQSH